MSHGWPTSSYDFNELINELRRPLALTTIAMSPPESMR